MIYLDNAATTFKKPDSVIRAMDSYMKDISSNPGRGGHRLSLLAGKKIYECRELLAQLFNISHPENIIFTLNTTMALNMAIIGYVKKGDHIVISGMEHNSVYRPVVGIGCDYTIAEADETGYVSVDSVKRAVKPNTSLIIINHASNVVGTINPITEIGLYAKTKNIPLLVDSAQTAGVLDIDVQRDNISMLAFAGHKMLFGPTGTGGLYISPDISLSPIIFGGTGSASESAYQPDFLPDRLESGTLNAVGISGLLEGVKFVLDKGTDYIYNYERQLTDYLISALYDIKSLRLYGNKNRVGVVSFEINGIDSITVCNMLDDMDIASRGGLHCAPLAHKSLGTDGLVRLSICCFTSKNDIEYAIKAIKKLLKQQKQVY